MKSIQVVAFILLLAFSGVCARYEGIVWLYTCIKNMKYLLSYYMYFFVMELEPQ